MDTTTLPFQVGDPVEHRGIVVAPLFPLHTPNAHYVTLDEAIVRGLTITETSTAGEVGEVTVSNPLADAVLLYDGEELVGAKQNRIVDTGVLVGAGTTLSIPVLCVEQGRWRPVSPAFAPSPHLANAELRRARAQAAAAAPPERHSGVVQQQVWHAVGETLDRLGVASPTAANTDAFRAHRDELATLASAFEAEAGQCGAVLALGDTLCLDAVSRPDAFARLWPKLRAGYLLDALGRLDQPAAPTERLLGFVDEAADAPVTREPSPGLGTTLRLHGPGVLGSGLELDAETIQLSVHSADE